MDCADAGLGLPGLISCVHLILDIDHGTLLRRLLVSILLGGHARPVCLLGGGRIVRLLRLGQRGQLQRSTLGAEAAATDELLGIA